MRNLKKLLALVLAMMMVLSLMLTVNAADPAEPKDFSDKTAVSQVYSEAVNVLSAMKIVKGDENGFRPQDTITRAEVAAMIYRIATADVDDTQVGIYTDYEWFDDVKSWAWYAGYVNYCGNAQYVKGHGGSFNPDDNITGYEALAMVLRVVGYDQNHEFEGASWHIKTAAQARAIGMLKNIKEGTLGAAATREVVAEIIFQALQVPTVSYNMLQNYYPNNVLIADTQDNRDDYANAIDEGLQLPLNADLMYQNFDIVGKSPNLTADAFGRPAEAWVKDLSSDLTVESAANAGDASKYIPNDYANNAIGTDDEDTSDIDETALVIPMTPVKVYDNAIDECHLTKEINNDKSIAWAAIDEVLNGEPVVDAAPDGATAAAVRTGWLDATHTTTKYIGATGRTTEIYKLDETININKTTGAATGDTSGTNVNKWIFVYVDTLLGKVDSTSAAIKDTAGHVIKEASATVKLGNATGAATLTLENPDGKYKSGDLVLIQTPNGVDTSLDGVEAPELAPLTPTDVPDTTAEFPNDDTCVLLSTPATKVENVTINATVGARNAKMGIIGTDGKTYYASNAFLASRQDENHVTTLTAWYDGPDTSVANHYGINNSMIGRTFNLALDQHGYIIGMDEVVTVDSSVGVITGIDTKRAGAGKYVTTIEAFMSDGTTGSFDVVGLVDGKGVDDAASDSDYRYWQTSADADNAWIVKLNASGEADTATGDGADGGYGYFIGIGSLVKFASITMPDGGKYWKIDDWASGAAFDTVMAAGTRPDGGVVKGDVALDEALTGVTATLTHAADATNATRKLDDKSVIFVAEYEYRYNTKPDENEGSNTEKTYKVYNGFKTMPTIVTEDTGNILYQQLQNNSKYVLIYAKDTDDNYIIKNQSKITVDDSYLVLSRGATYAEYSVYNVLKNGVETTIQVANNNSKLNEMIESTMEDKNGPDGQKHLNELLLVTGRNAKGYVTSVSTVTLEAATDSTIEANVNSRPADFEIIAKDAAPALESAATKAYSNGVLRIAGTNASGEFLTVDDNVIVKIVNRDLKTCYDSTMAEAMNYANGVDDGATADGKLDSHDLVYELNELGYVCALYVID